MRSFLAFSVWAFVVISVNAQCGKKDGYYPSGDQCDAFVKCESGQVIEKGLCEDGLVFDQYANPSKRNCVYPFNVDCTDRPYVQPAQATKDCPNQFAMIGKCQSFIQCVNGQAGEVQCPEGLVFNNDAGVCDWPDRVPECKMEDVFGFTCPEPDQEQLTLFGDHARYAHPTSDDRYYVCMRTNAKNERNLSPRLMFCSADNKFDHQQLSCQPTTPTA